MVGSRIPDRSRVKRNRQLAREHIDFMRHKTVANHIVISKANTDEHELMKYLICRQLCNEGKEFFTECIFKSGKRADILCTDDMKVIEVLHSETYEMFAKKLNTYPDDFEIIPVKADQEWNEKLIY